MASADLIDDENFPKVDVILEEIKGMKKVPSFACSVCQELFTFKSNLRKHLRTHFGKKPYKCPICGISVMKRSSIDIHIAFHIGGEIHKCVFCREEFSLEALLHLHLQTHNPKKFTCDLCLRSFSDSCKLKNHYGFHKVNKPYVCIFCQRSFLSKNNLKVHYRVHTGERPYVCDICQKDFITQISWKKHCLVHTKDSEIKKDYYRTVFKKVRKRRRIKQFIPCHVCNKLFPTHTQMSLHLRTHTGENPFTCNVCNQGFSAKFDLFRHLRTHTG